MTEDAVNIVFCPSFFFYYSFLRGGGWTVSTPSLLIPFPPTSSPGPLPSPLSLPAITFLYFFLFFLYGICTSCCSFFLSFVFIIYSLFHICLTCYSVRPAVFVSLFPFSLSLCLPPFSLTSPFLNPSFVYPLTPKRSPNSNFLLLFSSILLMYPLLSMQLFSFSLL